MINFGHSQNLSKKKTNQGPRARAPFPLPVNTTPRATLFLICRALTQRPLTGGRAFQAAALCLKQGFAKYGAYAIGNNLLRILAQKASRARGWPPFSLPVSTTRGATAFLHCRILAHDTAHRRLFLVLFCAPNSTPLTGVEILSYCSDTKVPIKKNTDFAHILF